MCLVMNTVQYNAPGLDAYKQRSPFAVYHIVSDNKKKSGACCIRFSFFPVFVGVRDKNTIIVRDVYYQRRMY